MSDQDNPTPPAAAQSGVARYWINAQLDAGGIRILPEAIADGEWVKHADHLAEVARLMRREDTIVDGDTEIITSLRTDLSAAIHERDEARAILARCLQALPVGNLPAHTADSIPDRIAELVKRYAETDALEEERDAARAERDAYRKAKAENDERFMIERDEARAEVARLRESLRECERLADGEYSHATIAHEAEKALEGSDALRQQLDAAGRGEVAEVLGCFKAAAIEGYFNSEVPEEVRRDVFARRVAPALACLDDAIAHAALPKPSPATADPMAALLRECRDFLANPKHGRCDYVENGHQAEDFTKWIRRIEAALPKTNEGEKP